MKRFTALICLGLFVCMMVCGCSSQLSKEQQYYVDYLEMAKEDQAGANIQYVHYEDDLYREMAAVDANLVTEYEIYEWLKASESLWIVDVKICSQLLPDGIRVYNFVGYIDGKLRVMQNIEQIPEYLKEGLNLDAYAFDAW